nr:unnamed protein product [Spirometra erinaceieuropaei]
MAISPKLGNSFHLQMDDLMAVSFSTATIVVYASTPDATPSVPDAVGVVATIAVSIADAEWEKSKCINLLSSCILRLFNKTVINAYASFETTACVELLAIKSSIVAFKKSIGMLPRHTSQLGINWTTQEAKC